VSHEHPQYFATSLAAFDLPLFVLYLLSMILTSLMTPPPADPQQARQQKMMMYMMPLMFGWFMYSAQWPAAFTFYWLVLNIVSTAQQYYILKQHPPIPAAVPEPRPSLPETREVPPSPNGRDGKGAGSSSKVNARPNRSRKSRR
jgi:YidC/Oxa1 family membrane protein insertase